MNEFAAGVLACVGVVSLIGAITVSVLHRKNRDIGDAKVRMMARQYQAMTASAERDIPMDELARPELISSRMDFRKIDAIEAELINDDDHEMAQRLLKTFFHGEDPWVRARAAKALYRVEPGPALNEIKNLVEDKSTYVQIPGIWALGELATQTALDILMPMVDSEKLEIEEAVIRCLIQMENKQRIPAGSLRRVKKMLKELRFKTDWIL